MAEAEDVITDVARHATVYARDLWRRHRPATPGPAPLLLSDAAQRLDLLITAAFGRSHPLRIAQPPAPPTWLQLRFAGRGMPPVRDALPATDGQSIWLPGTTRVGPDPADREHAFQRLRTMGLQQAMRAARGSVVVAGPAWPLLQREVALLLEARAADDALVRAWPGVAPAVSALRRHALQRRPALASFSPARRRLEQLARWVLSEGPLASGASEAPPHGLDVGGLALPATAAQVVEQARALCTAFTADEAGDRRSVQLLWRDLWTGDLRPAPTLAAAPSTGDDIDEAPDTGPPPHSARLLRRPQVRDAIDEEDDTRPGAWMVQPAQPHEQAEDPFGLQRPTDRDSSTAADDFADALSELPEARLVAAPGRPKEILISDDPPDALAHRPEAAGSAETGDVLAYPEWDWRIGGYREPGASVHLLAAPPGPQAWLDETLERRRGMLHEIRRRFELLRARRVVVRKQPEGDEIDLQACIESHADASAGLPRSQRLYLAERRARRDLAITLLVDVSGSTDSWIAGDQRVIDVEREALLLVCVALDGLGEPYSVLAFSGEGPHGVVVRGIKRFDERYDTTVAARIAGLQPERYTRAGAAIRHASTLLMTQPATHRLLLLLSDGKPNDIDAYDGRYGVEDMRQAVTEARLQGISPFCLTVDRRPASYLPAVFGPHHYAMLPRPEQLPLVLLDWLRRLVTA